MNPIVFLHIPKTAGQAIHNALTHVVGGQEHVSPVRVNWQANGGSTMPPGYRLYSGHIDWVDLETLPPSFVFTVLRDPRERIASYYFYMVREAQEMGAEQIAATNAYGKALCCENTSPSISRISATSVLATRSST